MSVWFDIVYCCSNFGPYGDFNSVQLNGFTDKEGLSMKVVVLNGKGFMGFVLRHMFGIKKLPPVE